MIKYQTSWKGSNNLEKHEYLFHIIKPLLIRPYHGSTHLLVGLYAGGKKCKYIGLYIISN